MMITLHQLGRDDIFIAMGLVDHDDPTRPLMQEPDMAAHAEAVSKIGLSLQQRVQIADGMAVFTRLLEPVLQVRLRIEFRRCLSAPCTKQPRVHMQLCLQTCPCDLLLCLFVCLFVLGLLRARGRQDCVHVVWPD